jgi:hypothetical protein
MRIPVKERILCHVATPQTSIAAKGRDADYFGGIALSGIFEMLEVTGTGRIVAMRLCR